MTRPIKPSELIGAKKKSFPDAVLEGFNELIVEKWDGTSSTFTQDAVIERILSKDGTLTRGSLFAKGLLDVEPVYEAAGWRVEYDKPGYCETYSATFTFKKRRAK